MTRLSEKYDRTWSMEHSMSGNVLLALESLLTHIAFSPGMKVLDLACGKGLASICLAKEFGATVYAVDRDVNPTTNRDFFTQSGVSDLVTPLRASATRLPFAHGFFDAIIIVNSYGYFGTDDKFLPYISQFLKVGGKIGVADICFATEINQLNQIPSFIKKDFSNYWHHIHSVEWWKTKFEKAGVLKDLSAEVSPDSDRLAADYVAFTKGRKDAFAEAMAQDREHFIKFFTMVGTKNDKQPFLERYRFDMSGPNYPEDDL